MSAPQFILFDKHAPAEFKKTYQASVRNVSAINATYRVLNALHALIDEAGFQQEMEAAVRQSTAEGATVLDVLLARERAALEQIEAFKVLKRGYAEACDARKAEVQPLINQALAELSRLGDEIRILSAKIARFNALRASATEKFKAAGLTDNDIATIGGVKPTHGDLAEWKLLLAEKNKREEQISRFFKSAPEYDVSILDNHHEHTSQ